MKYDYQWFWENFGSILKSYKVEEKSFFGAMWGDSKSIEFEIEGKIMGYITIYTSGVIELVVLDGNDDTILNVFTPHQNEKTEKEKEEAFEKLMEILTRFAS